MKVTKRFLMLSFLALVVGGIFSPEVWAQQAGEIPVCTAPDWQRWPVSTTSMKGGRADGVIIAWRDGRDNSYYAQKLDLLGRPLWGPCGFRVDSAWPITSNPFAIPQIVSTGNGDALFVYVKRVGGPFHVFATVLHYDPQKTQAPLPVQLSTFPLTYVVCDMRIASSGNGFIVTWDASDNIYAQKLTRFAQKLWGDSETVVVDYGSLQANPEILADGKGGIYVTFLDNRRANGEFDIYGQRLDEYGNRLWGEIGKLIYLNTANDNAQQEQLKDGAAPVYYPHTMAMSADGNFIVVHPRNYAQGSVLADGVNGDGNVLWNRTVDQNYYSEYDARVISDGSSGGVVFWLKQFVDNGEVHIYASRINQNGYPIWSARRISEIVGNGTQYKALPWHAIPNGIVLQSSNIVAPWLRQYEYPNPDVLSANLLKLSSGCALFRPSFRVSEGLISTDSLFASVNLLGAARLIVYEKAGDIFARFIPNPTPPHVACHEEAWVSAPVP